MNAEPTRGQSDLPDARAAGPAERLRIDVAMLCELFDSGVEVDGAAALTEGARWAIYGRTTYDGEVILATYDDEEEAVAVLRSVPLSLGARRL